MTRNLLSRIITTRAHKNIGNLFICTMVNLQLLINHKWHCVPCISIRGLH